MKKIACIIIFFSYSTVFAQLKFNINTGITIPNLQNLNTVLSTNTYQTLPNINRVLGAEINYVMSDGTTLRVGYNFIYQQDRGLNDKDVVFEGRYGHLLYGFRMLNREKTSLEIMTGTAISNSMFLKLRDNTPTSATFIKQIQSPTSNINELELTTQFYINIALEYRRKIKFFDVAIRAGYTPRISEIMWQAGGQPLTDVPKINPIGGYFTVSLGF